MQFEYSKPSRSGYIVAVLLVVFSFGTGLLLGQSIERGRKSTPTFDLTYLNELYHTVEQNYLGTIPDQETVVRGMAKGLIDSLGDKYSTFLDPAEAKEYMQVNDSAYEGIGVQLGFNGEYTTVVTPIDGYPGQQAGLLPNDLILKVDDVDVSGKRPELVANKIRGEAGSTVKLLIYRESEVRTIEFSIVRSQIDLENISVSYDEQSQVVIVDIVKFTEGEEGMRSGVQVFNDNWDKAVQDVKSHPDAKALVLDLRNNPGGYVEAVKYVAEDFLRIDQVLMQEQQASVADTTIYKSRRDGRLQDIPVVVLVNEASASASEILAAALQDNDRAQVVGRSTVGKGVEQQLLNLDDGSLLLLTFRKWLTPLGRQINAETPIAPDVVVDLSQTDLVDGTDPDMLKAYELLGI